MHPEIQKAVDAGKLTPTAGQLLDQLQPGTYVLHKSWGFGQVDSLDFLLGQMAINFKTKKGHSMQLQYAAESLAPIDPGHILALKAANLAGVKEQAKNDPVGLTRTILTSLGGKANQDQISQTLVPEVLSEAEFKRWFENAKKVLKADGHFAIPAKKGLPFELREGTISHADEYLAEFSGARQLKAQIKALETIIKHAAEFPNAVAQLQPVINAVNESARKASNVTTQVTEALTLLATRDELREKVPTLFVPEEAPTIAGLLKAQAAQLSVLLTDIPAAKTRRAIAALPLAFGEEWVSRAIRVVLLAGDSRTVQEAANLLIEQGKLEDLRSALERDISGYSLSSPALVWLCGDRSGPLTSLLNALIIGTIIAALERDAHNEKKDRKLHDLLMNDQDLLVDLISDASAEDLRDLMRKLLMTTVFADLNKRSLLGRIVRVYPELESMITGGGEEKQETTIVSWESMEKRQADLDELIKKKIPENVREISTAREHGDLRENFEFKAAKDMQRVLNRRRADWERDLALARGTDFANPDTNQVSIGTIITLQEAGASKTDVYTILGAWDGDVTLGILSYQSALAKAVIGHKIGDKVTIPTENGDREAQILKIEAYKK